MNSINDDFAKNIISGLLDFIFNRYLKSYLAIVKRKDNNLENLESLKKKRLSFLNLFKKNKILPYQDKRKLEKWKIN